MPGRPPSGTAHPGRRLVALSVLILVVFGALAFRVAQLQVLGGDRYNRLALQQTVHTVPLPAQRGREREFC